MSPGAEFVARGAEALVERRVRDEAGVIAKRRLAKPWREPALDQRVRETRTRLEARLLADARAAGVRTPIVLDVDVAATELLLEEIRGEALRRLLPAVDGPRQASLLAAVGAGLAKLHAAGIVHGDLTTSNLIAETGRGVAFIDFGLGDRSSEAEDRGVDLHVLDESLHATHPEVADGFKHVLNAYFSAGGSPDVRAVLAQIDKRGRYRGSR